MATTPMNRVIQHLVAACGRDGMTDGELLTRFLSGRDDDALATLMLRHGPMVWGVCCRLLRSNHDAEDAFQATFLVLVQKAATLPNRETVGNWLYGVAHQTAVRMRAVVAKRGVRERQVAVMPEPATAEQYVWSDLLPVLDEELSRLPDKYRVLIVLCDLEGVTRKEVARRLDLPEGTAASRLAAARAMLAKRLVRRGVVVSSGLLGGVLSQQSAWASVPTTAVNSTINAATLVAAGRAVEGAISPTVAALNTGVMNAMFMTKIKSVLAVVLIAALVGGTGLIYTTAAAQGDKRPPAGKPMEPAAKVAEVKVKDKEAFTAWGERVGWLQVGLGFSPGERRAYSLGETVTLVVRVRNIDGEEVKFEYLKKFFDENSPVVTDADGKSIPQARVAALGFHEPEEVSLPQGKEIELASVQYELRPASESGKARTGMFKPLDVAGGKVSLQYERVFGNTSAGSIKVNPDWLKLATGKLELEIKDKINAPAVKPKDEKKGENAVGERRQDAGGFGEAVDGLRIKLQLDRPKEGGKSPSHCVVVMENVGDADLNVQLGYSLANGKSHHPAAPRLVALEGENKTLLTYAKSRVAGRLDPFVVPLPVGSSYTLRCPLDKFVPEKRGERIDLTAKDYRVVAELVGQPVTETSSDLQGFALMQFWRGTVQSNEAKAK